MNQLRPGPNDSQTTGPDAKAGTADQPGTPAPSATPVKYDAVAGPFTIRDLTVFGSVLLMFIASLLPMFGGIFNLWNIGSLFFLLLGIILPAAVVGLFVARRLQPATNVRIGSLSTDQFASVTAAFATTLFFLTVAMSFNGSALLGLIGSLGLLAATVLGPHLPFLSADFKGRAETPAHVVARQAVVPTRKPAAPKEPKAPKQGKASSGFSIPGLRGSAPAQSGEASGVVHSADSGGSPQSAAGHGSASAAPVIASRPVSGATAVPAAGASTPQGVASPANQASAATQASPVVSPASASQAERPGTPAQEPAGNQPPAGGQAPAQPAASTQPAASAQPAAPQPTNDRPLAATMATPIVSPNTRTVTDSIGATVDPASRPDESQDAPHYEAFWFAVAQPRTAYDERTGAPAFVIEPGGWVLALEDRGHEFLVQDTDGKLGVLRELSNIERG
ncbi:hypothetical protein ACIPY2_14985 [Paenarthrobacter sp. NPDC089675]|uniref:hypothetical protein n=1 Tax=Paenarthrobacter sp. NPDC089675 TaxID=3364376 RepID=UPI00380805D0